MGNGNRRLRGNLKLPQIPVAKASQNSTSEVILNQDQKMNCLYKSVVQTWTPKTHLGLSWEKEIPGKIAVMSRG